MAGTGHQDLVILLNADETVASEMTMTAFDKHLQGEPFGAHAASRVKAAYCVVASGLNLVGVAYFAFSVDESGVIDSSFNLPLKYLVQQAGLGGDLDGRGVRVASRAQCPVPWHSTDLWEPTDKDLLQTMQQRIYRNKLNIRSVLTSGTDFFAESSDGHNEMELLELDFPGEEIRGGAEERRVESDEARMDSQELISRLEDALGQDGRLTMQDMIRMHSEQLNQARTAHRRELEVQQSGYLEQIKTYRDEIHELKVALRQEQSRNRRLQEMLRGDP